MESKRFGSSVLVVCLVFLLVVSQEVQAHESKDSKNGEKFMSKCLAECKENSSGAPICKDFCGFLVHGMPGGGPQEFEAKLSAKSHKVKHAVQAHESKDLFGGKINLCLKKCNRDTKASKAECQEFCTYMLAIVEGAKKSKSHKVKH